MKRREFGAYVTAAVAGILAGTFMPGGTGEAEERHFKGFTACQGLNDCKGKGGCATSDRGCIGKNTCKGKGGCAQVNHVCKGHNVCKGLGGCKTGDKGCRGKNSCRGKGGCAVPSTLKGKKFAPSQTPANGPRWGQGSEFQPRELPSKNPYGEDPLPHPPPPPPPHPHPHPGGSSSPHSH